MDGVIVDSMPYHFISWHEALRPFGVRVSCTDVYMKEGAKWDSALRYFLKKEKIKPSKRILGTIFYQHKKIFNRLFKRHIFEDAKEILKKVKTKGYKLGLVTGTNQKRVKKILPAGIYELFDNIVTGDHVKKGKPHPDPYLKAAQGLGIEPQDCVVIENAPYGIESAKKAGMFCIAITTSLPKEYLSDADIVINKIKELSPRI